MKVIIGGEESNRSVDRRANTQTSTKPGQNRFCVSEGKPNDGVNDASTT